MFVILIKMILNEVTSLNYSDLLFHQLWKKEDFILNNLRKNELLNKEIVYLEENDEKRLSYLKSKIALLEKELIYNKEIYKSEKEEYEKVAEKLLNDDSDFENLIIELYNYYINEKNQNQNKKNKKSIATSFDIKTYISSLQKELIEKEEKLNELKFKMDKYANEDKILFDKVVSDARAENKQIHINNMKKLMEFGGEHKLKLMKIPKEKIILKYKKSEPAYYLKKKEKKIKIDPEIIEQLQDEELLTYE